VLLLGSPQGGGIGVTACVRLGAMGVDVEVKVTAVEVQVKPLQVSAAVGFILGQYFGLLSGCQGCIFGNVSSGLRGYGLRCGLRANRVACCIATIDFVPHSFRVV
jgi:hypothetical protein